MKKKTIELSDLKWFKFTPNRWLNGLIQKQTSEVKVAFMTLVCQYWNKKCVMTVTNANDQIGARHIKALLKKEIIKLKLKRVHISFLDEQMHAIKTTCLKNKKAANIRWKNTREKKLVLPSEKDAGALQAHTERNANGMQKDADKIKIEIKTKIKNKDLELELGTAEPFHDEVLIAWNDWIKYRRKRRITCTPATLNEQIIFLKTGGRGDEEIKQIIKQSIMGGYNGLFELKNQSNGRGNHTKASDRAVDRIDEPEKDYGIDKGF